MRKVDFSVHAVKFHISKFTLWGILQICLLSPCNSRDIYRHPHRISDMAASIPMGNPQIQWDFHHPHPSAGAQYTTYLTIYSKIIIRSTYDSDLRREKISLGIIISQFTNTSQTFLWFCKWIVPEKSRAHFVGCFVNLTSIVSRA